MLPSCRHPQSLRSYLLSRRLRPFQIRQPASELEFVELCCVNSYRLVLCGQVRSFATSKGRLSSSRFPNLPHPSLINLCSFPSSDPSTPSSQHRLTHTISSSPRASRPPPDAHRPSPQSTCSTRASAKKIHCYRAPVAHRRHDSFKAEPSRGAMRMDVGCTIHLCCAVMWLLYTVPPSLTLLLALCRSASPSCLSSRSAMPRHQHAGSSCASARSRCLVAVRRLSRCRTRLTARHQCVAHSVRRALRALGGSLCPTGSVSGRAAGAAVRLFARCSMRMRSPVSRI